MANRRFVSQFSYSFEKQPVRLMGSLSPGSVGAFASKVTQGLTLTAVLMGSAGNSITIAFTGGGTAGAEVVSVSGNAISVQIESGVSSITQVRTALNASAAAAALVATTGTSASAVSTGSALPLLSGADTAFTVVGLDAAGITVTQTGTGIYKLAFANSYNALIGASFILQRATAVDLVPQIQSSDVTTAKAIYFRMNAGATPTNMASADKVFVALELRNSSGLSNS